MLSLLAPFPSSLQGDNWVCKANCASFWQGAWALGQRGCCDLLLTGVCKMASPSGLLPWCVGTHCWSPWSLPVKSVSLKGLFLWNLAFPASSQNRCGPSVGSWKPLDFLQASHQPQGARRTPSDTPEYLPTSAAWPHCHSCLAGNCYQKGISGNPTASSRFAQVTVTPVLSYVSRSRWLTSCFFYLYFLLFPWARRSDHCSSMLGVLKV